jgi:hypothetical protein
MFYAFLVRNIIYAEVYVSVHRPPPLTVLRSLFAYYVTVTQVMFLSIYSWIP